MRKPLTPALVAALLFALLGASAEAQEATNCAPPGSTIAVSCRQLGLGNAGYPTGATPQANAQAGTVNAVTATLPAVPGQYTYLCTLEINAAGGTATISPITITGLLGGTWVIQGISAGQAPFSLPLLYCLRSSAPNTAISATTTADATATAVDVHMAGYSQ